MDTLTKIRIFPTDMRLSEWIAFEEGYFRHDTSIGEESA